MRANKLKLREHFEVVMQPEDSLHVSDMGAKARRDDIVGNFALTKKLTNQVERFLRFVKAKPEVYSIDYSMPTQWSKEYLFRASIYGGNFEFAKELIKNTELVLQNKAGLTHNVVPIIETYVKNKRLRDELTTLYAEKYNSLPSLLDHEDFIIN